MLRVCAVAALVLPAAAQGSLGPECQNYLKAKGIGQLDIYGAEALRGQINANSPQTPMPCQLNDTIQSLYAPNPNPPFDGVTDTTELSCMFGNPSMWGHCNTCCGLKPHFNWVLSTCEETQGAGQFCSALPKCAIDGSPKVNYVAAYQYNGTEFVLMEESSVGEFSDAGIAGNWHEGTGFSAKNESFRWRGGDWTTKYAPFAKGTGVEGPRGLTPPAALWILSAENFYYGAFYFLSQLGLNLDGQFQPTGTNCWNWELDPVEGTLGWDPGHPAPGNMNMLYNTDSAQSSGCMPIAYSSKQMNGLGDEFKFPEIFRDYCQQNPEGIGCRPGEESISWSGGALGSQRFENLWDVPYVFAILIDQQGYWTYRWRPDVYQAPAEEVPARELAQDPSCNSPANSGCTGLIGQCCPNPNGEFLACCTSGGSSSSSTSNAPESPTTSEAPESSTSSAAPGPAPAPSGPGIQTGWPGVTRYNAARRLAARPNPVKDPRGLKTDVPGDVAEAVMLLPSLSPEASCLRSSIECVNWQFGSNALAAIVNELGEDVPGGEFWGAQNWWTAFADTHQNANYPLSIAGVDASTMKEQASLNCNRDGTFSCQCAADYAQEVLRGEKGEQKIEEIVV